ncbi:MAG: polynucleotide kinase-phosphatase [Candidatus Dormibacteraeota bacterium]|nr:polynucleotide kinase-phosphatase [Candidatus Dormibacteraeota bacterium]
MTITIPELSLVVLVGATSSGKSSFARKHFLPTEVISSDACRAMVADDENALDVNPPAFAVMHAIASARLGLRRLAVIDATNVQKEARRPLVELARDNDVLAVAIVFDLQESVLQQRSRERPDRNLGPHVVRNQIFQLHRAARDLQREGFRYVTVLRSQEEVDAAVVERQRLWTDRRDWHGPFDVIGDVHGCQEELVALLGRLGYQPADGGYSHPEGRKVIFLGDLVDRGPSTPGVLRIVMAMTRSGSALCVPGNHDIKLMRALQGRQVTVTHGLAESLAQLEAEPFEFRQEVASFIDTLVSHLVLDDGRLVVAHAGMAERLQGRASRRVRDFALYGETTGETDEFGLPVRYNWAADYRGAAMVVYGHTPVPAAEWLNNTICIDTGCVFGGRLTALRYPERELVEVPAARMYYQPTRPLAAAPAPSERDSLALYAADVLGRRTITTRLVGNVTIPDENAAAALEAMSRFAVDPRWIVYLPPTMSPPATTANEGLLEHPAEAFDYFRRGGVEQVVCQEKHMGSRAVAIVGRDPGAIERRFHIASDAGGIVYTRTGRRFFADRACEAAVLERLRNALDRAGLWGELASDWAALDMEVMPWSVKAGELLVSQYSAVASAAEQAFAAALPALDAARARGVDVGDLADRTQARARLISGYRDAYRRYCWDVKSVDDLRIAPFHLLASGAVVHADRDHVWHMATLARLASDADSVIVATAHASVDLADPVSERTAIRWWEDLVQRGAEGMVVKPLPFVATGRRGLLQPAVKCRGPEYLRIIYGPEYTLPANLSRLRERSLGLKRSLAVREFALGIEALERFVRSEGLHRVHECVFGILALESEPVDPRL